MPYSYFTNPEEKLNKIYRSGENLNLMPCSET
jgi:hypothetical protein